jgi:DeoR family transcriptional regulator of aga operon
VKRSGESLDREFKILSLLFKEGPLKINDLARLLGVSEATIRRVIRQLEHSGRAILSRGTVRLHPDFVPRELTFYEKLTQNIEAKKRIGAKAAELIKDGESILLETGTTVLQIVPHLRNKKNVTVVTNCLKVATEVASQPNLKLILIGGEMRRESTAFVGPLAEETLQKVFSATFISKVFMGADGVSLKEGVTTPNIQEAVIDRMMAELGREVILVVDHSKFGKVELCRIMPIERVNTIITDYIEPEYGRALQEKGVKVIIA